MAPSERQVLAELREDLRCDAPGYRVRAKRTSFRRHACTDALEDGRSAVDGELKPGRRARRMKLVATKG